MRVPTPIDLSTLASTPPRLLGSRAIPLMLRGSSAPGFTGVGAVEEQFDGRGSSTGARASMPRVHSEVHELSLLQSA
jgi:hypothetical protein